MSKKKWTDIFKKDLLALVKTDQDEDPSASAKGRSASDMFFKGAWKEEGGAKWAFFEGKEEKTTGGEEEEEEEKEILKVREVEQVEPDLTASKTRIIDPSEVVSITDIGRNLTSRYQSKGAVAGAKPVEKKKKSYEWQEGEKIRVFFTEDNSAYQRVLNTILNKSSELEVIGSASNGQEAVDRIKKLNLLPHVVLMDIAMPVLDGVGATEKLLSLYPFLKIIILSAFDDRGNVLNAFRVGATGYLRKDAGMNVILTAIKEAARGGSPPMQDEIAEHLLAGVGDMTSVEFEVVDTLKKETVHEEETDEELEEEAEEEFEEVEMTEEEFIEEFAAEIVEELLKVNEEAGEDYLKEFLKEGISRKVAEKFINALEYEEIPEGMTRDYLAQETGLKIVESFEKKLKARTARESAKYEKPRLKSGSLEKELFQYKEMLRENPKKVEEVISFYEKFRDSSPDSRIVAEFLAWAYMKKGLLNKALKELLFTLQPGISEEKDFTPILF